MAPIVFWVVGCAWLATGLFVFAAPADFFVLTPGVAATGPYNPHFVRDVGLAFIVSGGAVLWGVWRHVRSAVVIGAAWPAAHALFHAQHLLAHGAAMSLPAMAFEVGLVITAPLAVFLLAVFRRR